MSHWRTTASAEPAGTVLGMSYSSDLIVEQWALFEPVFNAPGTNPAHSGRGLARAVCAQMLRAARQFGVREAVVGPRGDPGFPLPRRVYEGLGMREVTQFVSMTNARN